MSKGAGPPKVTKKILQAWVRKAINYLRLLSLTRNHTALKLLVCDGAVRDTFLAAWENARLSWKMSRLTMLSMFRDVNATGMALKGKMKRSFAT